MDSLTECATVSNEIVLPSAEYSQVSDLATRNRQYSVTVNWFLKSSECKDPCVDVQSKRARMFSITFHWNYRISSVQPPTSTNPLQASSF